MEVSESVLVLEGFQLLGRIQDRRAWVLDSLRFFSIKYFFFLGGWFRFCHLVYFDIIWKTGIPSEVQVFCCFLFLDELNTHDFMQRRKLILISLNLPRVVCFM